MGSGGGLERGQCGGGAGGEESGGEGHVIFSTIKI